jgi:hypothetical protein
MVIFARPVNNDICSFEFNAEVVWTLYAGANLVYEKESYAVTTKDRSEAHSVLIRVVLLEH